MNNKFTYAVFIICLALSMQAQDIMTLEKAIAIALENNFQIKISERSIELAEVNNSWARAGKYPTIDLNGSLSNSLTNDQNPASFLQGTYYNGSLGASVDAQWLVYGGGRVRISKDQLDLSYKNALLNSEINIHDAIKAVIQSYYNVLFQNAQLQVFNQNFLLSKDKLGYEQTKRDYGASNQYTITQFENDVLSDSISVVNQANKIEIAKRELSRLLNEGSYKSYEFNEKLSVEPEDISPIKVKEKLSEENFTLKSLAMMASVDQLNVQMVEAMNKPTVSLTGSLGINENAFKFFEDNPNTGDPFPFTLSNRLNGRIGAAFNWNLYDGGLRRENLEAAKLQGDITELNILEAKAMLNDQIDILITNYQHQLLILELSLQQIALAEKSLDMTELRFKNGQLSSLDYRNIQNQYLVALFGQATAIYNLLITKSEIDYLVGVYE